MPRKTGSKKLGQGQGEQRLDGYDRVLTDLVGLLEESRRTAARSVNAVMTASYWLVGRRIVEEEQGGQAKAQYGKALVERLSADLSARFGRGFGRRNLFQMRAFNLENREVLKPGSSSRPAGAAEQIVQTPSAQSPADASSTVKVQTASAQSIATDMHAVTDCFPLPWSQYVKLQSVKNPEARAFYEAEALRDGWNVRQLNRQISSQFYERTLLSKNKAAMLKRGQEPVPEDAVTPEEQIKDPFILEFLGLKDEYSESDLESALIQKLETFLLELGGDFTFVGRQRRLRIGDAWYRVDLLFFHRRLRALVIIDLKLTEFTHADAGQMHMYLNYAREHWTLEDENPPVGLILCAHKNEAVAHYALDGLPNKVLAAEYRTTLPDEERLAEEIRRTRRRLERQRPPDSGSGRDSGR